MLAPFRKPCRESYAALEITVEPLLFRRSRSGTASIPGLVVDDNSSSSSSNQKTNYPAMKNLRVLVGWKARRQELSSPSFSTTEETDDDEDNVTRAKTVRWSDQQHGGSVVTSVHDILYVRPAFIRVVVLLIHPGYRRFEFLHCEIPESRLTVWDMLQQLPSLATEASLQGVQYTALCRHRRSCRRRKRDQREAADLCGLEVCSSGSSDSAMGEHVAPKSLNDPSSRDPSPHVELIHRVDIHCYELFEGEILLAIPDGFPLKSVVAQTEFMLQNRQLMRLLQRAKLSGRALRRLRPSKPIKHRAHKDVKETYTSASGKQLIDAGSPRTVAVNCQRPIEREIFSDVDINADKGIEGDDVCVRNLSSKDSFDLLMNGTSEDEADAESDNLVSNFFNEGDVGIVDEDNSSLMYTFNAMSGAFPDSLMDVNEAVGDLFFTSAYQLKVSNPQAGAHDFSDHATGRSDREDDYDRVDESSPWDSWITSFFSCERLHTESS